MTEIVPITVAYGDGIGPEIMQATIEILKKAEAKLRIETIEVGEKLYVKNYSSGISESSWESIARTKILLKSPITTPQGGGYKSLNVTLRKSLGLYANIRPSVAYFPFVQTNHPQMNLVIIRENEEDLYAGIEYRHTHNMRESIKLISRTGCEKIIRYAFEYAISNGRKKVTCMSKDNIMKFSDGIFHEVFNEMSKEYPTIKTDHYIIDIGTARIANNPEIFDVIVTSNLFGDIISDVASEISGSVGLAPSSNIGANFAMFEAIHGSAPDIAGKDIANPSGLINAAVMMLVHIGQNNCASLIENAWKRTIEDGIHTADIFNSETSTKKVGCAEFAQHVIKNLGNKPNHLKVAQYSDDKSGKDQTRKTPEITINTNAKKQLVGCDVFIGQMALAVDEIVNKVLPVVIDGLQMEMIACKGLKLWPRGDNNFPMMSDHWCCRFKAKDGVTMSHQLITDLLDKMTKADIDFIKLENLYEFDGKRGYSLAQGE